MTDFIPRKLLVAAALTVAASPSAFAQDGSAGDHKRFSVVGGATVLQPHSDPSPGSRIDIDGDVAPTLSATWHVDENWGVELWGAADRFSHRVRGDGGKIGTIDQQPIALSGQYHFGTTEQPFRPFVGLGYAQSNISREDLNPGGDHVGLGTPRGAIGTVGVDMNITPTWFARADARYMRARTDAALAGETFARDIKLDPWMVGVGVGARF